MIHLFNDWYLGSDARNIMLLEKKLPEKKRTGNGDPEPYYVCHGYFQSIGSACDRLMHISETRLLSGKEIISLMEFENGVHELTDAIRNTHAAFVRAFSQRTPEDESEIITEEGFENG